VEDKAFARCRGQGLTTNLEDVGNKQRFPGRGGNMHPEILRELTAQRGQEMRARARRANLVRAARRASRRRRDLPGETDWSVVPAIPDYVDGSFRTHPAEDKAASEPGRAPAARHAA
jgi:hypothetical protein